MRLYSDEDYQSRDPFTTPEIRRTNLASVVLRTKTLRLGRLEEFPLLDPPRADAISQGTRTLIELGALDDRHELTDVGWKLGRLPVDPRVGRIILAAEENGSLPEVLPIAAALEIQDPRDRPPDRRQAADEAHAVFADSRSDFISYLRLWRYYEEARGDYSRNKLVRELRKRFLSPTRMREWADVYRQLREMATTSLGDKRGSKKRQQRIGKIRYCDDGDDLVDDDRYAAIHQALLAGLLSGVAMAGDKKEYTGSGGLKLFLWPGSGLFANKPKWIVAAELVETSKQFARTVARIEPRWIEQVGDHLLKRTHHEPHWSGKAGGAFCYENLLLFGLPVVTRRRVPLPPIDPVTSRDLLIDHGLAERQLRTTARFVRHNRALRDAIAQLAARTRRRELVIDDYVVARFYQSRLPATVFDRGTLEKHDRSLEIPDWARRTPDAASVSRWLESPAESSDSQLPFMRPDDLLDVVTESIASEEFPDQLSVGSSRLPLAYRFEPGSDRDGVNITIHQAALSQVSDDRLGWLVPGLLQPKLVAMIKSLPKRIRRNFVPAAEVAESLAQQMRDQYGEVPFMSAVCQAMSQHAEMPVTPADFQQDKLADHFEFLVTVVDDEGKPLAESRELTVLQNQFGKLDSDPSKSVEHVRGEDWARESTTTFDFDELPTEVVRSRGGVQVAQYPGLIDLGDSVSTDLFPDRASAETSLRLGTTRLYAIAERKELRNQVRWLPAIEEAKVKLSGVVRAAEMESALVDLLARVAFVEGQEVVRTRDSFEARRRERGQRIARATQEVASWLDHFAQHYFSARKEIESIGDSPAMTDTVRDVRYQIQWLLSESFLSSTPWKWLQHYPRYFRAIAYRLDKARGGSARDQDSMATIAELWVRWMQALPEGQQEPRQQMDCEFRWMIEELRVSLFAQPLGTAVKVSPQRCEKLLK